MRIDDWLDLAACPAERPGLDLMSAQTRELHEGIDKHIRASGTAYLHPIDKTVQLDLLSSKQAIEWQEAKVAFLFEGNGCWSELPQLYGRYGTVDGQALVREIRVLEDAGSALACDSGMQATAVVFDVLLEPGAHAVMFRQVYNKTAKYLSWLSERVGGSITIVDDGDLEGLARAIESKTTMVFAETYSNPLTRALDLDKVPAIVAEARSNGCPRVKLVVDSTIASCWGTKRPLLRSGVDVVLFSGTKSLGGQDRDLGGFIATNDSDLANAAMDLLAMRGGILDWRRAAAFLEGLPQASAAHLKRCQSAARVAAFLASHPSVKEVFHPSLPDHLDAEVIARGYERHGSLLSFRFSDGGEQRAKDFSDALATCLIVRYALSFDGLTTKVNHHKSVSEYFTPDNALARNGIDGLVRLGVGMEDPDDICAALNWTLHHGTSLSSDELAAWRQGRIADLGLSE
jgi:cystathionine beta-lyase/cystathionine gamma-synthase